MLIIFHTVIIRQKILVPANTWTQFEQSSIAVALQQIASVAAGSLPSLSFSSGNGERHILFVKGDTGVLAWWVESWKVFLMMSNGEQLNNVCSNSSSGSWVFAVEALQLMKDWITSSRSWPSNNPASKKKSWFLLLLNRSHLLN